MLRQRRLSIAKCASYNEDITAKLGGMFDQLGGLETLVRNKTVTIKLNMTGAPSQRYQGMAPALTIYAIAIVVAMAYHLGRAGAKRIRFVESPWAFSGPLEEVIWIRHGIRARSFRLPMGWSSKTRTASARARPTRGSRFRATLTCTRRST